MHVTGNHARSSGFELSTPKRSLLLGNRKATAGRIASLPLPRAWADKQFVFVCGLHRSGTSLVHRLLRAHPEVSGFAGTGVPEDEGQHLQSVFPNAAFYGGPGQFGFSEAAHLTEDSQLATESNLRRLLKDWRRYWDLSRRLLLEKSPPNLIRMRFLQRMFRNGKFVVIIRHPLAVSYATQKWSRTDLSSLIEHWLVCHERMRADCRSLDRVHLIRYEDLVTDPGKAFADTFRFLQLPAYDLPEEVSSGINEKYFLRWHADYPEPDDMIRRFEARVQQFGYSLDV